MTTSSPLSSGPTSGNAAADATSGDHPRARITVPALATMRAERRRISMVTAYDVTFARLVDRGGVDIILVGDSVGMVVQGEANTIPVDLDEMEYHVRLVARAGTHAMVVGDLPFGSYQVSPQQAVESSVRLMKAGAQAVKLEGGVAMAETIAAITRVDIPVMGHIGLTPQSYHRMGGHRVQGRKNGFEAGSRERLLEDAHAVEQAGAFSVVLEGIPLDLAADITQKLSIPTIGIGAGNHCDGQVLVLHDLLGLSDHTFKFAKAYADLRGVVVAATQQYVADVRDGAWPDDAHSFH
ncbi:unannotated protein [freshwater metagenome]|uniref:3-methyl-2-oxobutanoate hydroxymethyltransferase n=1 Tax=freshwater metagenome TaxID=449393 RepID=A0A6J7FVW9_9ZZZZ|nr:3-methyl-2-oxobutanoate hydroxymethyltransferase [Actinomycetota bacterium]